MIYWVQWYDKQISQNWREEIGMWIIKDVFSDIARNPTEFYNQYLETRKVIDQIVEPISDSIRKSAERKAEQEKLIKEEKRRKRLRKTKFERVKYKIKEGASTAQVTGLSDDNINDIVEILGSIIAKDGKTYPVTTIKKSAFLLNVI